nr:bcl-2-like protein 13 [Misgurnus anguillicaudatus]
MEPEVRSLEASEIVLVSDDQSENHSSNSDIVHLEADLHGRMESDEEEETDLQSSMLSMLGSDKELAEMAAEFGASLDVRPPAEPDLKPPESGELLMCVEDPFVEDIESEDDSHTPLVSESLDFTLASVPISEIISQVLEHLPSPQELHQTPLSTHTASGEAHIFKSEPINAPSMSQDRTASSSELVPHVEMEPATSGTPVSSPFEFPVLLVGGAALVAIMGVLTYTLRR